MLVERYRTTTQMYILNSNMNSGTQWIVRYDAKAVSGSFNRNKKTITVQSQTAKNYKFWCTFHNDGVDITEWKLTNAPSPRMYMRQTNTSPRWSACCMPQSAIGSVNVTNTKCFLSNWWSLHGNMQSVSSLTDGRFMVISLKGLMYSFEETRFSMLFNVCIMLSKITISPE